MATTGLLNGLIRLLLSSNVVDVEIPFYVSQSFANGQLFHQGVVITGTSVIALPTANILFLYVKAVSGTVTVTLTPNGGASAVIQDIAPGGILILDNPSGGFTALTIGKAAVTCTYDLLIGG